MSNPATEDLKPGSASTRQIALALWVTFSWYFHEPEPNPHLSVPGAPDISELGSLMKDWRLEVHPKGILGGRQRMIKLERLGLVACHDSSVGAGGSGDFGQMFTSQKAFWQLDPRLYLVSLTMVAQRRDGDKTGFFTPSLDAFGPGFPFGAGPNTFGVFLPTYYPPQPLQYTMSENARYPIRPKGYRQGEVFYVRYIPSGGQYLISRVPVLPYKQVKHQHEQHVQSEDDRVSDLCVDDDLKGDVELLHKWMEQRPVDTALTRKGPVITQLEFLKERLSSQNMFPVLACWGSVPNSYIEFFWVLEDWLGHIVKDVKGLKPWYTLFYWKSGFLVSRLYENDSELASPPLLAI